MQITIKQMNILYNYIGLCWYMRKNEQVLPQLYHIINAMVSAVMSRLQCTHIQL